MNKLDIPDNFMRILNYERENSYKRLLCIAVIKAISSVIYENRKSKPTVFNNFILLISDIFENESNIFLKALDKRFVEEYFLNDFNILLNKLDSEEVIKNRRIINNYYLNQLNIWNTYNSLIVEIISYITIILYPLITVKENRKIKTYLFTFIFCILSLSVKYKIINNKVDKEVFINIDNIKKKILDNVNDIIDNNDVVIEFDKLSEHSNDIINSITEYINTIYDNNIMICPDYNYGNVKYRVLEKIIFVVSKVFIKYNESLYTSLYYSAPVINRRIFTLQKTLFNQMKDNSMYDEILNSINKRIDQITLYKETDNIFTIINLEKKFNKNLLYTNVNLKIPKNKWTCVNGNSGCGKSTFIKNLIKYDKEFNGKILFCDNESDYDFKSIIKNISYLKNSNGLFKQSVFYNIYYGIERIDSNIKLINHYIKEFKLSELDLNDNCNTLSTGQQQRIKIIRMIVLDKPIWIFDEITSNINDELEVKILNTLRQIQKEKNKTVIHITHNINNIIFCDYLMKIKDYNISIEKNI
jgi:ABC-type cobalamin/Fe3+-siderophores transport system ATPase subunit